MSSGSAHLDINEGLSPDALIAAEPFYLNSGCLNLGQSSAREFDLLGNPYLQGLNGATVDVPTFHRCNDTIAPTTAFGGPEPPSFQSTWPMPADLVYVPRTPWFCRICGNCFAASHELESHARAEKHRAYWCSWPGCGLDYCRRDSFVRHMATHSTKKRYPCPYCPKIFKRKDTWLQHSRNAHPIGDPLFDVENSSSASSGTDMRDEFDACGKSRSCRSSLERHDELRLRGALSPRKRACALNKVLGPDYPISRFSAAALSADPAAFENLMAEFVLTREPLDIEAKQELQTQFPELIKIEEE